MAELFRTEAINHASRRLDGEVMMGTSVSWAAAGYLFATIALAILAFSSTATYARKESVTGWLVPKGGIIRIAARDGGIVEAIQVREGQTIAAGDTLASIRLSTDTTNGDNGRILEETARSEIIATSRHAETQVQKIRADQSQLQARQEVLQSLHGEAVKALALMESKAGLAQKNLDRAQELNRQGYMSQQALDATNSAWLAAQQDVSSGRSTILSYKQQLADLKGQIDSVPILIAQSQSAAKSNQAVLSQKLQQIMAGNAYELTAPIAGRVVALPAEIGQTVTPGSVVMVITPENSHLEAEVYVPSRAAGFIKPGQEVSLQYQAFPYQKFGSRKGRIVSVSRTVLAPGEVTISGLSLSEPVFRVRVALDTETIMAYGAQTPLQPGMLLNANIVIDRRTLIEWLLDPIYAVGKRG